MNRLFLLLPLALTGCATYNESFDCEPGKGVGCVSLSQVNYMVDKGELPLPSQGQDHVQQARRRKNLQEAMPAKNFPGSKRLRIWIAPHQDPDGMLHDPATLNVPLGE
jgi:hypothetical protein